MGIILCKDKDGRWREYSSVRFE
ncbi:MAG: hypothetical protein F6K00_33430 [Leptolyngbya sp. SIOISBB]|nr:hypothetical protein [Leptolyngbya sp. SIOISBB]